MVHITPLRQSQVKFPLYPIKKRKKKKRVYEREKKMDYPQKNPFFCKSLSPPCTGAKLYMLWGYANLRPVVHGGGRRGGGDGVW